MKDPRITRGQLVSALRVSSAALDGMARRIADDTDAGNSTSYAVALVPALRAKRHGARIRLAEFDAANPVIPAPRAARRGTYPRVSA